MKVTILGWRDAMDPPADNRTLWTNRTVAWYRKSQGTWMTISGGTMRPQPTLWCDPTPPTEVWLTAAHVSIVLDLAAAELNRRAELDASVSSSAANTAWVRLRAALPEGA